MSDPLVHEVAGIALRAERASEKLAKQWRRLLVRIGLQADYRRIFCDSTGAISDAGAAVLRDLARQANFGRIHPGASEAELRENEGARRMLLHIIARIDAGSDELRRLSERMREKTDGRY